VARQLTPKQEKFAQLYIELGDASAAYRGAYSTGKMKPASIWRSACVLLKNVKVASRIEEIRKSLASKFEITIETITRMLQEDRENAIKLGQTSAAVAASMGLAKLHGLIVDKVNQKNSGKLTIAWEGGNA
jgi:phage terminase small subunit